MIIDTNLVVVVVAQDIVKDDTRVSLYNLCVLVLKEGRVSSAIETVKCLQDTPTQASGLHNV